MCFINGFNNGITDGVLFRQSMLALAQSSTLVSALVDGVFLVGRVVAVDFDNFQLALISSTAGIPAGSIVNVGFNELGAITLL